uniref:CUB domain-containing protein n=1 Tax=Tetranychus urticae TaxID=32264 RepID=T1KDP6_TETUR
MIKMYFLFLLIFVLITFKVEAEDSCYDCLTKTYCISSDGSGVCSKHNLVKAKFQVLTTYDIDGLDFYNQDLHQLTLKSYNVAPDEEKTIKVSFDKPGFSSNVYTCYKSSQGSTNARFHRGNDSYPGSSSYDDGVLTCSWSFFIYQVIWPLHAVDLIKDGSRSITLYHDSLKVTVAQDTSQLPIYHAQYYKCCNKVHGNDEFMLTFDRTKTQIRYRLYYWKNNVNKVNVTLTRKDGIKLQFQCYLHSHVKGYIIDGTQRFSVDRQLLEPDVTNAEICSWVTPFVLGDSRISIDSSSSVFDLQVEDDSGTVYTEKAVELKNSLHYVKFSFIMIAFVVLSLISIRCFIIEKQKMRNAKIRIPNA